MKKRENAGYKSNIYCFYSQHFPFYRVALVSSNGVVNLVGAIF